MLAQREPSGNAQRHAQAQLSDNVCNIRRASLLPLMDARDCAKFLLDTIAPLPVASAA